jgi:hypothetical protein
MDNKKAWEHYILGAKYALQAALGTKMLNLRNNYNRRAVEALRVILPYCLHYVENPDTLIWLNRDYKPLGVLPFEEWVDYEAFPWLHVAKNDPAISHLLNIKNYDSCFFLFEDGTAPWLGKDHALRLLKLIQDIKIKENWACV